MHAVNILTELLTSNNNNEFSLQLGPYLIIAILLVLLQLMLLIRKLDTVKPPKKGYIGICPFLRGSPLNLLQTA